MSDGPKKRATIRRKPGESITITDTRSGNVTTVVHRAPAGALEVLFQTGTTVVRSEILDEQPHGGEE